MKDGGASVRLLPTQDSPAEPLRQTLRNAIERLDADSSCLGWFLVKNDGVTLVGYSYMPGTTDSRLLGGTELLKSFIIKQEGI